MESRICAVCGKEFVPHHYREMNCSEECKREYHRILCREYQKQKRGGRPPWQPQEKTCIICGKTFWATHPSEKMCSDECRSIRWHEQNSRAVEKYREKKRDRNKVCIVCGKPFIATHMRQQICSDECRKRRALYYLTGKEDMWRLKIKKLPKPYLGYSKPKIIAPPAPNEGKVEYLRRKASWERSAREHKTSDVPYTHEELATIRRMYAEGETLTRIGIEVGRMPASIAAVIRRMQKKGELDELSRLFSV